MQSKTIPELGQNDLQEFNVEIAEKYFSIIYTEIKKVAPHKLYLGCRWDAHLYPLEDEKFNWVMHVAANFCDVLSVNRYAYTAADLVPTNEINKPFIIGEFHFSSLDEGALHYSLKSGENRQNVGELYKYYLRSAIKNPYVIGAHWFQYVDQPTIGRNDGENYHIGFVDICDTPDSIMIETIRSISNEIYSLRNDN